MPKQTAKSGLVARLGDKLRKAHETHKDDEIRLGGGGDMPPGIEGGVAQLIKAGFGQYKEGSNKGKDYFLARFVAKVPTEINGIPVEGMQFNLGPMPLCETPNAKGKRKTFDDHYENFLNELRKLGVNTSEIDAGDLESIVSALEEEKPHTRYRTWQGEPTKDFPNPRVNVELRGHCEYDGESTEDVVDETGDDSKAEEGETADEPEEEETAEEEAEDSGPDVMDMAKQADKGNSKVATQLAKLAEEAGIDHEAYDDWNGVAEAIIEGQSSDDESEEEEEETPEPAVEDMVFYAKPGKNPKTKKAYKPEQCEVIKVYKKNQTVDLKSVEDGKTIYKAVPWDKLEEE